MPLSTHQWHQRFVQQAQWTRDLRNHLYQQIELRTLRSILDVGCGTGSLLSEFQTLVRANVHGLDLNWDFLKFAGENFPTSALICGDALQMPYAHGTFDLTICHYFLLWVEEPGPVLAEMVRVTAGNGLVVALAEPDYGGRIDYPSKLSALGDWQETALRRQGADPLMGRQLRGLFSKAGLQAVEVGVLGGQWKSGPLGEAWDLEWMILEDDLAGILAEEEITAFKQVDKSARERGERVLFVPTFYALGRVIK